MPVKNFDLKNPWSMLEYQRNFSMHEIQKYDENTYVIISDIDEIPNPTKIDYFIQNNFRHGVFEQNFFYYKQFINVTQKMVWK